MKDTSFSIIIMIFLVLLTGIGIDSQINSYTKIYPVEVPTVNLPLSLRQSNWIEHGYGSCVWASLISLLRWQDRDDLAATIDKNYGGGEYLPGIGKKLNAINVDYAVARGDQGFLEWACNTRRGAAVSIRYGGHMVALVHINDSYVCLLDNNNTAMYVWIPRDEFMENWRQSGGWAFTPVYSPVPPLP